MDEPPITIREQLAAIEQREAQLTQYLADHPNRVAPPAPADGRPPAKWGGISVAAPFIGFVVACGAATQAGPSGWGFGALAYFILTLGGSTILGFVSAIIAFNRNEQRPGLATAGFILNGLVLLGFLRLFTAG